MRGYDGFIDLTVFINPDDTIPIVYTDKPVRYDGYAIHAIFQGGISTLFDTAVRRPDIEFEYNGKRYIAFLEKGSFYKDDNPVRFEFYRDYEGFYHTSTIYEELGSMTQINETRSKIKHFRWMRYFRQVQREGRTKAMMAERTEHLYNKILNLRPRYGNDWEFLKAYPEFNQGQVTRARKWKDAGEWDRYRRSKTNVK